jgi:hypothetical protein
MDEHGHGQLILAHISPTALMVTLKLLSNNFGWLLFWGSKFGVVFLYSKR